MSSLRTLWEQRAARFGSSQRGVLFHRLPDAVNTALDQWHRTLVVRHLISTLPEAGQVLDVGCGYGRLATLIRDKAPQTSIVGCDLAQEYCRAFSEHIGPAVCARLEALPFAPATFDAIAAVTVFMYTDPAYRATALRSLASLLRPGGRLLVVDPGAEFLAVSQRLLRHSEGSSGGHGFRSNELIALAETTGLKVMARGANPAYTFLLPLALVALRLHPAAGSALLRVAEKLDLYLGWNARLALHRYTVLQKAE